MREIIYNYLTSIFPSDVFSIAEEVYDLDKMASALESELENYWESELVSEYQSGYEDGQSQGYDDGYDEGYNTALEEKE